MPCTPRQPTGEKGKPRYRAPAIIPANPADQQRMLREELQAIEQALGAVADAQEPDQSTLPVQSKAGTIFARAGDTIRVDPPAAGITVLMETARAANKGQDITIIMVGEDGPVTVKSVDSLVQAVSSVELNGLGMRVFRSDGGDGQTAGGWWIVGQSSASPGDDAQYVLGAAHASLPNAAVGTDSTEVNFSFTPGGIANWILNTASVVFAKLQDLAGLSVLGRASNSSGVMAAITATTGHQALRSNLAGTAILWEDYLPQGFATTLSGTQAPLLLPVGFVHDSVLRVTITADVLVRSILMSDGTLPPGGFRFSLELSDQSGGSAPGWMLQVEDNSGLLGLIRTPGQVQGINPNPNHYTMRSEEEACIISFQSDGAGGGRWGINAGTAAQALTGDVTVDAGNGSTRTATIPDNTVTNAKAADMPGNTVKVRNSTVAGDPVDLALPTNSLLIRASGNIVAGVMGANTVLARDSTNIIALAPATNTVVGRQGGDVVATQVATAQIANDAVDNTKAANMAANTIKSNPTAGSADPQDLAIGANSIPARVGGNLVSHPLSTLAGSSLDYAAGVIDVVGNTAEIVNATATGNLGTIDISSLTCGGTYRITAASGAFSIEGFTAKAAGFWFVFDFEEFSGDDCTLLHEDATATATNRLALPQNADIAAASTLYGIFFYTGSRWRWLGADPNRIGSATSYVRVATGDTGVIDLVTASAAINITSAAAQDVNVTAGADIVLTHDGGNVVAVQSDDGTGGFLLVEGASSSGPAVAAGRGMYWVEDPGATATHPMFTDDSNGDFQIATVAYKMTSGTHNTDATAVDFSDSTAAVCILECTGATTLGAILGGYQGRILMVMTDADATLTLDHAAASTTTVNSLQLPGAADTAVNRGGGVFIHSGNAWRFVA